MVNSATGEAASASSEMVCIQARAAPLRARTTRRRAGLPTAADCRRCRAARATGHARPSPTRAQPRQRDARRRGEHEVDEDRDDRRGGRLRAQQRDEQRHADVARVRERRHQRAERRIVPVDAVRERRGHREADQHGRAEDPDADHGRVQVIGDGRRGAETVQHARQREVQHERVEPGDRRRRQHAPARGDVARQHQREERERREQDRDHGRSPGARGTTGTRVPTVRIPVSAAGG